MKSFSEITFPVYRRYTNGLSWFRIDSPEQFEELRVMGSKVLREQHQAKILPDRNFIYDLVFEYGGFAEEITAEAYRKQAELAA